jgi:hypothetical protein
MTYLGQCHGRYLAGYGWIEVLWVFEYFERKNENKREECVPFHVRQVTTA